MPLAETGVGASGAGRPGWPASVYGVLRDQARGFRHVDRSPADRALREVLPKLLRPGMRILDVGSGTGVMACHVAASGALNVTYLGIDPDAQACGVARSVLARLPTDAVRGRILESGIDDYLRASPEGAHLVVAVRSLHECLDPSNPESLSSLAARLATVVTHGGRLLVCEPVTSPEATADEHARIEAYGRTIAGDGGKPHVSAPQIHEAFEATGLAVESRREGPRLILGRHLHLEHARYYLLVLVRL